MKTQIKIIVCATLIIVGCGMGVNAQNLLDMQGWSAGVGSSGIFTHSGNAGENTREWSDGPQNKRAVLWRCAPNGDVANDGGWETQSFAISHTNMYRFVVWMKKTNSADGFTYFGCSNALNLNGTPNANPFFWAGDLPELDKWYLLVGYVHGSGDVSVTNFGGIYDAVTGSKVQNITDYKFAVSATVTNHRSLLAFDATTADRQYFYAPRVEVVNGNEPTIAALLGIQSSASDLALFSGKVGINTPDPGVYNLAVNGNIRAKEIKVETGWADFVFAKDYPLPTLLETEKHIKEKGHLPGIPSAAEVEKNGIELGDMNKKLLQKIEELTLYLIEQNKTIQMQNSNMEQQQLEIKALNHKVEKFQVNQKQ